MELCEHHLNVYDETYGLESSFGKKDNPTECDPKTCAWRQVSPCRPDYVRRESGLEIKWR